MPKYESVMRYDGLKGVIVPAKEEANTAGTSWRANDLVNWNGSGQIQLAAVGLIGGIAQQDSTGTTNKNVEVELIDPNGVYIIHAASNTTPAQIDVGEAWSLALASGACTLAGSAGAEKEVYIVGLHPADTPANGTRVLVRFSTTKGFDTMST